MTTPRERHLISEMADGPAKDLQLKLLEREDELREKIKLKRYEFEMRCATYSEDCAAKNAAMYNDERGDYSRIYNPVLYAQHLAAVCTGKSVEEIGELPPMVAQKLMDEVMAINYPSHYDYDHFFTQLTRSG